MKYLAESHSIYKKMEIFNSKQELILKLIEAKQGCLCRNDTRSIILSKVRISTKLFTLE